MGLRLLPIICLFVLGSLASAEPLLWFAKADLPRLRQLATREPEAAVYKAILQQAEAFCTPGSGQFADPAQVDRKPPEGTKTVVMGHFYGRHLTDWLETLGFAYQLTGDERFAKQGVLVLDAAVHKLPVTHPDIAPGFAGAKGDIMRGFAVGYDWLNEAMTPEQKQAWAQTASGYVRNLLAEAAAEKTWWRPHHNFMGVAIGAAGLLSLKLSEFYPAEASAWQKQCADLIATWLQEGFDEQGAYYEGTSYGQYGLSNAIRFLDALQRAGGPDLFQSPRLRRVPHFYALELLPGERVFDARNDAGYDGLGDPTMLRLATAFESGLARWLWDTAGTGASPFRIIWANDVPAQAPAAAGEPLAEHFRGRGLCVWRTGWSAEDVMLAVEAGPYYPVTHNQADEGHFTLYGLGQRWALDSGYGNNRLPGGRDSTMAHNCVLIDGEGMAPSGAGAGTAGKIAAYANSPAEGYALADATEAYNRNNHNQPGVGAEHARRHVMFQRPTRDLPAYAVVLDDIRKDGKPHDYTWLLHTPEGMRIDVLPDGALLTPASAAPQVYVHTPLTATGRGECEWSFEAPQAGEYTLWGRVRAVGPELGKSDSFLVQVDGQEAVHWHAPTSATWAWGKVTSGVPAQPITFRLEAGKHALKFMTRETGAQLERVVVTPDAEAKPPFAADHKGLLLPEQATIKAPMALVRTPADANAPRLRLWLTAAAPVRFSTDSYDDHQRLKASVTVVQPEFAAVLMPLPGGTPMPQVQFERKDGRLQIQVQGKALTDVISWPDAGDRRPTRSTGAWIGYAGTEDSVLATVSVGF